MRTAAGRRPCAACIAQEGFETAAKQAQPPDALAFAFVMGVAEALSRFTRDNGMPLCEVHERDLEEVRRRLSARDAS